MAEDHIEIKTEQVDLQEPIFTSILTENSEMSEQQYIKQEMPESEIFETQDNFEIQDNFEYERGQNPMNNLPMLSLPLPIFPSILMGQNSGVISEQYMKQELNENETNFEIEEENLKENPQNMPVDVVIHENLPIETTNSEGKKEWQCKFCEYNSLLRSNLLKHIISVHEGKKPYQCSICNAKFTENGSLKRHISSVHEGKKPHHCTECNNYFTTKTSLTKHIAATHKGKKPFECQFCPATFARKDSFTRLVYGVMERYQK